MLNEPDIPVIRATRLPSRNNFPGLVKIEVDSETNKVKILRKKGNLKETERYKKVFLRSSKSHVERLLELNIQKLLDEIPYGRDKYRLTANGRLVVRDEFAGPRGPPHGPPPHGPPPHGPPPHGPPPHGPPPHGRMPQWGHGYNN